MVSLSLLICNMGFLALLSTPTNTFYKTWSAKSALTLQDEPSDYHSNIYFMRSKNILHFSPELFQNQLISSCWKRAHCSFDTKDRALLFSFKSAFGGWTAERELSFIMLPCQKDTTLCKRNEVEQKNLLSFPHALSHWHTVFK